MILNYCFLTHKIVLIFLIFYCINSGDDRMIEKKNVYNKDYIFQIAGEIFSHNPHNISATTFVQVDAKNHIVVYCIYFYYN